MLGDVNRMNGSDAKKNCRWCTIRGRFLNVLGFLRTWNQFRVSIALGELHMDRTGKVALFAAAFVFINVPFLSQAPAAAKLSFDVVSIKPTPPGNGPRGGGPQGDRFTMKAV